MTETKQSVVLLGADAEQSPYSSEQIHAQLDCTPEEPCPLCIVIADAEARNEKLTIYLRGFVGIMAKGRDCS